MARVDLRHPANAAGDWFVDERCIDCGTCRELAPALFADVGPQSVVSRQPASPADEVERLAGGAGLPDAVHRHGVPAAASRSPLPPRDRARDRRVRLRLLLAGLLRGDGVVRPPRRRQRHGRLAPLHPGPPAPAARDGRRARTSSSPTATMWPTPSAGRASSAPGCGSTPTTPAPRRSPPTSSRATIPWSSAPGSSPCRCPATRRARPSSSSTTRYLFSGDSLAWSHDRQDLTAFRDACWWSWSAQTASLARLADSRSLRVGAARPRRPGAGRPGLVARPPGRPRRRGCPPADAPASGAGRPSRAYVRWPH